MLLSATATTSFTIALESAILLLRVGIRIGVRVTVVLLGLLLIALLLLLVFACILAISLAARPEEVAVERRALAFFNGTRSRKIRAHIARQNLGIVKILTRSVQDLLGEEELLRGHLDNNQQTRLVGSRDGDEINIAEKSLNNVRVNSRDTHIRQNRQDFLSGLVLERNTSSLKGQRGIKDIRRSLNGANRIFSIRINETNSITRNKFHLILPRTQTYQAESGNINGIRIKKRTIPGQGTKENGELGSINDSRKLLYNFDRVKGSRQNTARNITRTEFTLLVRRSSRCGNFWAAGVGDRRQRGVRLLLFFGRKLLLSRLDCDNALDVR